MTTSDYFQRPHLLAAILIGLVAFLLLTLAAAKVLFQEEPIESRMEPTIGAEQKSSTASEK